MPQSIPPYLFAFAVGNIVSRDLGPRSRVYTEPETLDRSAWEFADVDSMLLAAEEVFGPYLWDRFDFLVMPSSFPYGGMENPRLTFLTPTLLAGDRSLVNVLAHELAHSWTGNLVTNATIDDFWLNEGFTVWAERRIHEKLYGKEAQALSAAIGRNGLEDALASFGKGSPFTCLKTDGAGKDPDEFYSLVPYEKGFLFVSLLEQTVGREKFDAFIKKYIRAFLVHLDHDRAVRGLPGPGTAGRRGEGRGAGVDPPAGRAGQRAVVHIGPPGDAEGPGRRLDRRQAPGRRRGRQVEPGGLADLPAGAAAAAVRDRLQVAGREFQTDAAGQLRDPVQLAGHRGQQRLCGHTAAVARVPR